MLPRNVFVKSILFHVLERTNIMISTSSIESLPTDYKLIPKYTFNLRTEIDSTWRKPNGGSYSSKVVCCRCKNEFFSSAKAVDIDASASPLPSAAAAAAAIELPLVVILVLFGKFFLVTRACLLSSCEFIYL